MTLSPASLVPISLFFLTILQQFLPSLGIYVLSIVAAVLMAGATRRFSPQSISTAPILLTGLSLFLSLLATIFIFQRLQNLLTDDLVFRASILHLSSLFLLLLVLFFFASASNVAIFVASVDRICLVAGLPLSIVLLVHQAYYFRSTIASNLYQGGTSWLSLILFSYFLSSPASKNWTRVTVCILSAASLVFASKRASLVSAILVFQVFNIYKLKSTSHIVSTGNSLFLVNKSLLLSLIFMITPLILFGFVSYSFLASLQLEKLALTLTSISNIANFSSLNDSTISNFSGGRNIELLTLLHSLNTDLQTFLETVLSSGYGIGWYNSSFGDGTASIHNSFLYLLILGGFPMLLFFILCFYRITQWMSFVVPGHSGSFFSSSASISRIRSSGFMAFAMGVDSFFSANLIVSPLALLLFFSCIMSPVRVYRQLMLSQPPGCSSLDSRSAI